MDDVSENHGILLLKDAILIHGEAMLVNTDSVDSNYHLDKCESLSPPCSPIKEVLEEFSTNTFSELPKEELIDSFSEMSILDESYKENVEGAVKDDNIEVYFENEEWLSKEKHVFVLSESGKPVYSRYGKEDRLVTLYGLMLALVSVVSDGDDTIRCIKAGNHNFVFLVRSPLIYVTVSKTVTSIPQIIMQLSYVHNQIVSVLTSSVLVRIFEKRRNYDFRHLLGGSERLLDNLLNLMDCHPSFLLGAVQCLPLTPSVRDTIASSIIQSCSKIKNLVFGLLIGSNQLIALVRMKKFLLHPADLHLLFNLVNATESLKNNENWVPICLPKFDPNGYLYGHISYISDECDACLLLLTVDKEKFFALSEAKQKIVERLRKYNCLEKITSSLSTSPYTAKEIALPLMRHFLFKSKSTAQYTCPVYSPPYCKEESQKRLFGLYQMLHHRIHSVSKPLSMVYLATDKESIVAWETKDFEVYASLEPLATKSCATSSINRLVKYIKSEENKLFILNSPTF